MVGCYDAWIVLLVLPVLSNAWLVFLALGFTFCPAAGKKPRSPTAANASKGKTNVAGEQKKLQVKAPPSPPTPRIRPPRNTPKKLWAVSLNNPILSF